MASYKAPITVTKRLFRLLSRDEQRAVVQLVHDGIVVLTDGRHEASTSTGTAAVTP